MTLTSAEASTTLQRKAHKALRIRTMSKPSSDVILHRMMALHGWLLGGPYLQGRSDCKRVTGTHVWHIGTQGVLLV